MFKEYEWQYEKVFSNEEKVGKKLHLEGLSCFEDYPRNASAYIALFRKEMGKFDADVFEHIVKTVWLMRRFTYLGRRRAKFNTNGYCLDSAFGVFIRNYVGHDTKFVFTSMGTFPKIITYMDDFFPNFDTGNPFRETYAYPFAYMNLPCLNVVYQMEERLDLLRSGEKRKLNYAQFIDYVINYVNCLNEDLGYCKYEMIIDSNYPPYVKDMIKTEAWKKITTKKRKRSR